MSVYNKCNSIKDALCDFLFSAFNNTEDNSIYNANGNKLLLYINNPINTSKHRPNYNKYSMKEFEEAKSVQYEETEAEHIVKVMPKNQKMIIQCFRVVMIR